MPSTTDIDSPQKIMDYLAFLKEMFKEVESWPEEKKLRSRILKKLRGEK